MSDLSTVETLLTASGLKVGADEIEELAAGYAALRSSIELLYAPEFSAADPLLTPTIH